MSARSAAAMAPAAEARCVPKRLARNHACFERPGSGQDFAHPVRRSLSEIPYLRPLEALTDSILSF